MIELATPHLRVQIDPDRGAEILFVGRPNGPNMLAHYDWATPLRPGESTTYGTSYLDWHAAYRGGWQELFPNAGAECLLGEVPLPYHGEVSTARWSVASRWPSHVVLRAACRLPLLLERSMRLDANAPILTVEETIVNESTSPVPYIWGHHPAFAVSPESRVDLPDGALHVDTDYDPDSNDLRPGAAGRWPHAPAKEGAAVDLRIAPHGPVSRMCYLADLATGWGAIRHPDTGTGIALAWDRATFPYIWLWQEVGGTDFPWYGRARITAIEPLSAWPGDGLTGAIARGQAASLAGGASASSWLTMALFDATATPVVGVERDGTVHESEGEGGTT